MSETTTRYCKNCDQSVRLAPPDESCPECGVTLFDWAMSPTIDLETSDRQAITDRAEAQRHADELIHQQLAHYKIERYLGHGGMASVFLATHETLKRPCAIKILRPDTINNNPRAIADFLAEARTAASLVHPHVVTVHNIGEANGEHFIELEYVDGNSLGKQLDERGHVSPLQATQWMLHISAALSAAHSLNLVHRDIKPSNVLVTKDGHAKLADFGLAKRLATDNSKVSGALCGTPSYMAPELFHGRPATTYSDIYAMGVTYYSLLTGRLPIVTQSIHELAAFHGTYQQIDVDATLEHLPSSLRNVVKRALSRDFMERYRDASELLQTLRALFRGLQPLRELVDEALVGIAHELTGECEKLTAIVALPEGRSQSVNIGITTDSETGEEIVQIFSVCGRATPEHYERALQLNAAMSHGSLGIQAIEGSPHFVMTNAYPRSTCDPEEVRQSVLEISKHSDEVERLLTDGDDR